MTRMRNRAVFLFLVFMIVPVSVFGVTVFKLLGGALALLMVFTLRNRNRKRPIVSGFVIALSVVLIAGIIGSFLYGGVNSQAVQKMAMNILLMIVVAEFITEKLGFRLALAALATGGLVVLASGLFEVSGSDPAARIGGLVGNPNGFGQTAAMTGVCLAGLSVSVRGWAAKAILIGLILASFVGLMYSGSRGAFLGLAVGLLALALFRPMRKMGVVLALLCAVSFTWLAPQGFFDRMQRGFQSSKANRQSGIERRLELSKKGLEIFSENPSFGVGLGNTLDAMSGRGALRVQVTHNVFAQSLTETGLIGFLAFMYVFVSSARGYYRVAQSPAADPQLRVTSSAFFVLFVATAVGQSASGNFVHPIWYVLFGVVNNLVGLHGSGWWRTMPVISTHRSTRNAAVTPRLSAGT